MKYLLATIFICFTSTLYACDSTILALLIGSSPQQIISRKMLAISQKMQNAGNFLNAFNHAAAKKLHHEIMENWLEVASQITVNPIIPENYQKASSAITIDIAKDIGVVRRKLESSDLLSIHEILEACITRISLLSAMINKKTRIHDFLQIELMIYAPRVHFSNLNKTKETTLSTRVKDSLLTIQTRASAEAKKLLQIFFEALKLYQTILTSDKENVSDQSRKAYQTVLNSYIKFKQQLLKDKFFTD